MLTRILAILGALFIVAVVLCGGLVYWAMSMGTAYQDKFFTAINSGKSAEAMALMHPALCKEIDEPVLQAWINEVNTRLGKSKGLSKLDFHTNTKTDNGLVIVESNGTVNFEKGTAKSEITFVGDQIVKFNVVSDKIPPDWFKSLPSSELYHKRAEEFLRDALEGRPEKAFAMMHEALQANMPLEKLQPALEKMQADTGKLKSVAFEKEEFQGGDKEQWLKVYYKLGMEKGTATGFLQFRFVGLKGHITAFNVQPDTK